MATSSKQGPAGSMNALVFCLAVLAVALGGIAGWKRYAQGAPPEASDTIEGKIDAVWSNLGLPDRWAPVGGLAPAGAALLTCRFVCPQRHATCMTHPGVAQPSCPACGMWMVPDGANALPAGGGLGVGNAFPVGGLGVANATAPIVIGVGAVRPHPDRGTCTNCHTVSRTGVPQRGQAVRGGAPGNGLWQAAAVAPPIRADAVKPALIKAFGIEVCAAPGGGVKISGVMGSSFASKAGLVAGDAIINCNGREVRDVAELQQRVAQAAPESNMRMKILRNGRIRDVSVMIGEGEMEGFTPIPK